MKLLVLVSRVPWPLEKGDKVRAYHQVRELHQHNEVVLCCLADKAPHPDAERELIKICSELHIIRLHRGLILWRMFRALFSRSPFQVHYFYQTSARRKIDRVISNFRPEHIYCQLIRTAEYVKHYHSIPKTIDYMDAFNKGLERRISGADWYLRPFVQTEFRRVAGYEHLIFDYFDHHTIISEQDKQFIHHPGRTKIAVIPNGIDRDFFAPQKAEKKYDVVFTGNMSYPPNISGAHYLLDDILPELLKLKPNCRVLIAGVDPPNSLLSRRSEQVSVSGRVPDIREAYATSRVMVAPMLIGTGLQNKLLEAMAMELPCITSELANNALHAVEGKHILIGRSAKDYAIQIAGLLANSELSEAIASAGREFVLSRYSWEESAGDLMKLMES